jgi:hypothetical protein
MHVGLNKCGTELAANLSKKYKDTLVLKMWVPINFKLNVDAYKF